MLKQIKEEIFDLNEIDNCLKIKFMKLDENQSLEIFENLETAILILSGNIKIEENNVFFKLQRTSIFKENPEVLHVSKLKKITINVIEKSEFLIIQTENELDFDTKYYDKTMINEKPLGHKEFNGRDDRLLREIFDYHNAPYSNLVVGEVITYPGNWSSYLPHYHEQPEVYFYKFALESGFGASFIGENVYKIKNNSYSVIKGNLVHPQVSAPGYEMYYCWVIKHLENNPWLDRIDEKSHLHLVSQKIY